MASSHMIMVLFAAATLVLACGCTGGEPANQAFTASGTVTFIDLEGGFYGIVADDGTRYLPQNLPHDFAKDGLEVTFTAEVIEDVATIQQWGIPIEIIEISEGA